MIMVSRTATATMTLDGEEVSFTPGETIYEVAARHQKDIPTLCYDPRLEPFGGCRLCAQYFVGIVFRRFGDDHGLQPQAPKRDPRVIYNPSRQLTPRPLVKSADILRDVADYTNIRHAI